MAARGFLRPLPHPSRHPHAPRLDLEAAVNAVKKASQEHHLADLIVVVERTGRYHLVVKQAFEKAGFEVRVIDPLATHQFRKPVHAGNKTDDTDLDAIHDAATHGLGLVPVVWPPVFLELQDWARHRRDLVEKATRLRCQFREHLHSVMPGYAELFDNIFNVEIGLFVALNYTVATLCVARPDQLADAARSKGVPLPPDALETILAGLGTLPDPTTGPPSARPSWPT